jgi:hypothetical protein
MKLKIFKTAFLNFFNLYPAYKKIRFCEPKEIKSEIRKVSMIVESRLLGQEMPTKEEVEYIKRFEKKRKEGKIKLIPLKEIE